MTTPFDRVRARHGTSEASHPYCEECAKPHPCDTALVLDELTLLKRIAKDLHWMARRYADGRSTYATSLFNEHTRALLGMGVEPNISGDGTPWARDAMGRAYDGLTEEEASKGTPLYDWQTRVVPEEMAWLRAELAALRAWDEGLVAYRQALDTAMRPETASHEANNEASRLARSLTELHRDLVAVLDARRG